MASGQCLFFHSSIRLTSGWFINVVGIVPQWSQVSVIFYSSIRLTSGWFINVVGIVPQWSKVSVYFFTLV